MSRFNVDWDAPPGVGDPQPGDLDLEPASDHALGRHAREPARTISTSISVLKPCASMIASVPPSRLPASNSRARRRSGLGLRLRLHALTFLYLALGYFLAVARLRYKPPSRISKRAQRRPLVREIARRHPIVIYAAGGPTFGHIGPILDPPPPR
jgi:hypothetical protein